MLTGIDRLWRCAAACLKGLMLSSVLLGSPLLGLIAIVNAEEASRWDGDARSAARLIAGPRPADAAPLRAGIEIRLKPGWHTYWRYPGDAGVPPVIDFKGSQNVKSVDVLWPAPRRLPEDGLTAIGYDRDVILPLRVVPQDRRQPVALRLKLDYAVCEKLCVPAEAKLELAMTGGSAAQTAASQHSALTAAEARVPKTLALGEGRTLAIRAVRREAGPTRPRVVVDVAAPAGAHVDLFAEGPTAQWSLPLPAAIEGGPAGTQRFAFDLDGAPPGADYKGVLIRLTAVADGEAIEVATRLD